jgi:hypothetical protein
VAPPALAQPAGLAYSTVVSNRQRCQAAQGARAPLS